MDSLTSFAVQKPTEVMGALIALSILVIVLLAYIYEKVSSCQCGASTSKSGFWGMWPLWQYGNDDAGMYGSMGRPTTPYQQWAVTGAAPSAEAIQRYERPAVTQEASELLHAQGDRYQSTLSDDELIRASRVDSADV